MDIIINRESLRVDINYYMIFLHKPSKQMVIIKIFEKKRLYLLKKKYKHISHIPDIEKVSCIVLKYNFDNNMYEQNNMTEIEVKFNELDNLVYAQMSNN